MRAGSSDGETPRREGALKEERVFWRDPGRKGTQQAGRTLMKWHDESKPLLGRQGGLGVLVSDGVGSGSLVTTLASCLPGLQLRHGLLAQEWTSRHEQGPQPATHRPAPQRHWSVPPHIPLAAWSVPCPHTPVPGTQRGSGAHSVFQQGALCSWGERGRRGGVRGEWNLTAGKDLSKQISGGGWGLGFGWITGGLGFRPRDPHPWLHLWWVMSSEGWAHVNLPTPHGAGEVCLILFQVCGH